MTSSDLPSLKTACPISFHVPALPEENSLCTLDPISYIQYSYLLHLFFLDTYPKKKSTRTTQPGREGHIPRQTRPTIQILRLKTWTTEKVPRGLRINEGQIAVQNASPAALDGVDSTVIEIARPFLLNEILAAGVAAQGEDGEHMDTLDEFGVEAEIGCVVDFVLEEDPGDFVRYDVRRVVLVVRFK